VVAFGPQFCSTGEKEFHGAINKLGKEIDKELEPDVGKISFHVAMPEHHINALIVEHLLQQGDCETARIFAKVRYDLLP